MTINFAYSIEMISIGGNDVRDVPHMDILDLCKKSRLPCKITFELPLEIERPKQITDSLLPEIEYDESEEFDTSEIYAGDENVKRSSKVKSWKRKCNCKWDMNIFCNLCSSSI